MTTAVHNFGVILAGGKSSRMGKDKAELLWQGKTLLARQFALMQGVLGADAVLVSGERSGYPHVTDESPDLGPLEGLRVAVQALSQHHDTFQILVCPVDMPHMHMGVFTSLLDHQHLGEVVKFRDFELPSLFTDTSKLTRILDVLCQPEQARSARSFRHLYTKLGVYEISERQAETFANTNTIEEWHDALSKTNHAPAS